MIFCEFQVNLTHFVSVLFDHEIDGFWGSFWDNWKSDEIQERIKPKICRCALRGRNLMRVVIWYLCFLPVIWWSVQNELLVDANAKMRLRDSGYKKLRLFWHNFIFIFGRFLVDFWSIFCWFLLNFYSIFAWFLFNF